MIKALKSAVKFIYNDIKTDIATLKEISKKVQKGESIITDRMKKEFTTGWDKFFKENWLLFLLLGLAFAVGWFFAAKHYQNICNTYIFENFIETDPIYNATRQIGDKFDFNIFNKT